MAESTEVKKEEFKRTNKKVCLREKGIKNFGFDFDYEMRVYKYAIGLKLSKKDYEKVCKHVSFNSYSEWEEYLHKKYETLTDDELIEFKKYLIQRSRNKRTANKTSIMAAAAIFSCFLTVIFEFAKECEDTFASIPIVCSAIVRIIMLLLVLVLVVVVVIL